MSFLASQHRLLFAFFVFNDLEIVVQCWHRRGIQAMLTDLTKNRGNPSSLCSLHLLQMTLVH